MTEVITTSMASIMAQALSAGSFAMSNTKLDIPPVNCFFFRLPSELKYEVLSYLDTKRDLYNVSKTCKWLESVALARLYRAVDLEIPAEKSSAWNTGGYLKLRPYVVRAIKEITIRDGFMDHTRPQFHRRRRSDAGCPESYAAQVVQDIPMDQLQSFSFMHRSPLSCRLLQVLNTRHGHSLKHLSCYELSAPFLPPSALPSNLLTLQCLSLEDGKIAGALVQSSRHTLKTLRLGAERALVEEYYQRRQGLRFESLQPLQSFGAVIKLSELKNLRSLSLTGLDTAPLLPTEIEDALYLTQLEELTLESCPGSHALLAVLTSIFTLVQSELAPPSATVPKLRKFVLRHEIANAQLRDALVLFLSCFRGLEVLSLLFENWLMPERLSGLLPNHGETLKELVIESRIQPRELLRIDTSRPFGLGGYNQQLWEESIADICRMCPNLQELSTGFPWNDEMIRIRQPPLSALPLTTMHIRNFPEFHNLSQVGDYSIKEHGIKFLEWIFGNIQGSRPNLETLSIGPTLYESRFKGVNPSRPQLPEFLRTHHFLIDWAKTRFGRWSAMITPVSEKYLEEVRGQRPLSGIFQQVWLR